LYRAPGIGLTERDRYQIMYEARAEPALSDRHTLVISYNVNSLAVTAACVSITSFTNTVIQPRFIGVPRSVFARSAYERPRGIAAVASRGDPPAAGTRDRRWFDSWKYSGGCPRMTSSGSLHSARPPIRFAPIMALRRVMGTADATYPGQSAVIVGRFGRRRYDA